MHASAITDIGPGDGDGPNVALGPAGGEAGADSKPDVRSACASGGTPDSTHANIYAPIRHRTRLYPSHSSIQDMRTTQKNRSSLTSFTPIHRNEHLRLRVFPLLLVATRDGVTAFGLIYASRQSAQASVWVPKRRCAKCAVYTRVSLR